MTSKLSQPWVPMERIESLVQIEPALGILGLVLGAWIASKVLLKEISEDRKRSLHESFRNLSFYLFLGIILFMVYWGLQRIPYENNAISRLITYVGLATILTGAVVFVKVWRILVFEYLFLSHMKVGFPVLLVNLFTLLLSIILGGWICTEIFNVRLAPLLATSAMFSLILGLALQDTLGNLFAGVALQIDKPYEIGDWVEIQATTNQKWIGQVYEITWRATVMIGHTEEVITIPNRIMGQAQIANFSTRYRPIIRSQLLRIAFNENITEVKEVLIQAAKMVNDVRKSPAPRVHITETTESWVAFKLIYFIDNYGDQYRIADQVYSKVLAELEKSGIDLANNKIVIARENEEKS